MVKKLKKAKVMMNVKAQPIESHSLGNDLEVWKVPIDLPIEQELNARVMNSEMFMKLADNIANRGALESLPLCAITNKGLELISGHHRVRAARKANINEIWVLVDVSGLSRDRLRSKQLAHNSLQGKDNDDLLRQIYESIGDAEARLEAYINFDELKETDFSEKIEDTELEIQETKTISLVFLPLQSALFNKALKELKDLETDEAKVATIKEYDKLIKTMEQVGTKMKIQSVPNILAKMSEIVLEYIDTLPKGKK